MFNVDKELIEAFDAHSNPRLNEIVERYRFFVRNQETDEGIDECGTDLSPSQHMPFQ